MPPFALALVFTSTFLHASWNLVAHSQRRDQAFFFRASLVVGTIGLVPVLWGEWVGTTPFSGFVWFCLALTGIFQALYFLGLTRAYSSGDFTVVYPVARALPVLILVFVDLARGHIPSPLGWLGMLLVVIGCFLSPLVSLRSIRWERYVNVTGFWVLVTALGGVGYSTIDKIAAEQLAPGAATAARYGLVETLLTAGYLWIVLRVLPGPPRPTTESALARWGKSGLTGMVIFLGYWLILWAFQLSTYVSYVVALRQFSIVIGVVAGAILFHEPAPRLRISAAVIIAVGVAAIALGG